ncbi:MAG: tRNA-intron lyase [Nitrososphaeraceae archaeon]|jgi:tRNA-intron endonuclease
MGSDCDLFVMQDFDESSFPEGTSTAYGDFQQSVDARLNKKIQKFIVDDEKHRDQLRNRGFGEKEDSNYVLKSYEALYLSYTKKITVKDHDKMLGFEDLVRILIKRDKNILTKFMVYRDLRSRGYIPKEGFGFGVDFRVYGRGEYGKKPAKYVVFGISEGTKIKADRLAKTIEQIVRMGKDAVVAVIERRGEVIYYKMSRVSFPDNKKMVKVSTYTAEWEPK